MSVQQIEAAAQAFCDTFNRLDVPAWAELLDEDLEVFDHVPYRFDNKKQFVNFLQGAASGLASSNFSFRQLSCRVFNDNTGIANAYDSFTGVTKDGSEQFPHLALSYRCQPRAEYEARTNRADVDKFPLLWSRARQHA